MNTCKDCLCYKACSWHIDEETDMTIEECSTGFMHKDQYVKLPAYVGQKVWLLHSNLVYTEGKFIITNYEIKEGKVSMIQQKADRSWKIRISSQSSGVADYTIEEFAELVYLTEASARDAANKYNAEINKKEVE